VPLLCLERLLAPDDPQLAMLDTALPPDAARTAPDPGGWQSPAPGDLHALDLDRIAADVTARYTAERYPAVVLGASHGAAVHLAALMGAAWLPSGIEIAVAPTADRPETLLSAAHGLAVDLRTKAPGAGLSQRFPSGTGGSRLALTWARLPAAYRSFLTERVEPGATVLVVRDVHPVVVLRDGTDDSVQLECPVPTADHTTALVVATGDSGAATRVGFAADTVALARAGGLAVAQLLFSKVHLLSQLVADTARTLLYDAGRPDSWLVVQHGRRIDGRPLAAGAVPYWCADSGPAHSRPAEWWLAASAPFSHIEVALDADAEHTSAGMTGWMSVCRFAQQSATVDLLDRSDTHAEVPPSHVGSGGFPRPAAAEVLARLGRLANRTGVLMA
jgi:hypothetical protein